MSVNVEEIMEEIRADIKAKGYKSDMLSFDDVSGRSSSVTGYDAEEFKGIVSYLNAFSTVPVSTPIGGNPIIAFIKKLIRKLTRVTVRPVVDHQSEYNAYTARAFGMVKCYIDNSYAIAELEGKLSDTEKRLEAALSEIERLSKEIRELKCSE